MDSEEKLFFDSWATEVVSNFLKRPWESFPQFTAALPGIYPADVLRVLHGLAHSGSSVNHAVAFLIESASFHAPDIASPSGILGLPPPHPLDFEWRFAPRAIKEIGQVLEAVTPLSGKIALVATPTFASSPNPSLRRFEIDYYGADARESFLDEKGLFRRRVVDLLCKPQLQVRYSTILMDPPWYKEHIPRFLYFAADALQLGGNLLLAMPAIGTRPGIPRENAETIAQAEALGLYLVSVMEGQVPYETPPFERNALRAVGIKNVGSEWRRGNLWVLKKEVERAVAWPGDIRLDRWCELRFEEVRFRVDVSLKAMGDDPMPRQLIAGDVLPTVSRSDSRRANVRIWTTGNRIFGCDAPKEFAGLFQSTVGGCTMPSSWNAVQRRLNNYVVDIIEREQFDLSWPTKK